MNLPFHASAPTLADAHSRRDAENKMQEVNERRDVCSAIRVSNSWPFRREVSHGCWLKAPKGGASTSRPASLQPQHLDQAAARSHTWLLLTPRTLCAGSSYCALAYPPSCPLCLPLSPRALFTEIYVY